jgi:cytochrome c biogenesis protein CcdA/thiol-disulfide isomerase/thioredoxin
MGSDQFAFEEVKGFMGRLGSALLIAVVLFLIAGQPSTVQSQPVLTQDGTALSVERTGGTVRVVYFYAEDCPHCIAIVNDLLQPLQDQYGDSLEIKMVEISAPEQYRLLLQAEALYGVTPEQRGLPTLILNDEVLIGEDQIRERLACLVDSCVVAGGTEWPVISGLQAVAPTFSGITLQPLSQGGPALCETETEDNCGINAPPQSMVWAAYFYQTGCQVCDRAKYDLDYVASQYPQLVVEEHNVQENAALAEWLASAQSLPERLHLATPVVFVGDDYLLETQIDPEALASLVVKYAGTGAARTWTDFDAEAAQQGILERIEGWGALTVAFAGLIDGLNPCAFATLIFFVSYLSLSGRRGRQVLAVGAAFTAGVFLAYLLVGIGFWKVLDLLGGVLITLSRWVYGITAALCLMLAVLSLRDFLRARRGGIGEMALNLPHALRMRINAVVRQGRRTEAFVAGAFVTGIVISFLELACTGQVYLPTIIFAMSHEGLRARAFAYLLIYNLLFILPLVVVFVLVYRGAGSKQLTAFLQRNAAWVKLGLAALFAALAGWLIFSLVA